MNVPVACENVVVVAKVRANVMVPVYPAAIVTVATLAGAPASMVALLVDVPLKVTVSPATGQVSVVQLAQVLQLLSAPPPSQVNAAALAGKG